MIRVLICCVALLGFNRIGRAGELDKEAAPTKPAPSTPVVSTGTELDRESPSQDHCWRGYWGWGPTWGYGVAPVGFYSPAFYAPSFYSPVYSYSAFYFRPAVYTGFYGWYGYRPFVPAYHRFAWYW